MTQHHSQDFRQNPDIEIITKSINQTFLSETTLGKLPQIDLTLSVQETNTINKTLENTEGFLMNNIEPEV